jgi:type I restriction enzyme S subunit
MMSIVAKSAMPKFNKTGFKGLEVPIPSSKIQQEIVEKLDAFENLIQSLEQEIKLRKQQYEYYREKLLTFEKE